MRQERFHDMAGMAYASLYEEQQSAPTRWLAVCALAAAIHLVPMLYLTLPPARLVEPEQTFVELEFTEFSAQTAPLAAAKAPEILMPAELKTEPKTVAVTEPPAVPAAPAAPDALKPKITAIPKPAAAQPEPKAATPAPVEAAAPAPDEKKVALHEPDLPALNPKEMAAFDESKTTKEMPKDGFASDRTSTAADKGPKNLPRGEAYVDKGESTSIRYLQKRGEGNLPALEATAAAGSVKKEGNPDAGKGLPGETMPEKKTPPKSRILLEEVQPELKPREKKVTEKPAQPQTKEVQALPALTRNTPKEEKADAKKLGFEKSDTGLEPLAAAPEPKKPEIETVETVNARIKKETPPRPTLAEETAELAPVETPRRDFKEDELAAFRALIDGKGKKGGRGGVAGNKAGGLARPGAKGHEGDGNLRPGHDEAVSDVTTVNLYSSAEDFDDSRFAKRLDPKAAYVKPLARRIDGKWKAEIIARNRFRLVRGIVAIRIIIRKDGKLMEASEVQPRLAGMPDDSVNVAIMAVKRATEPLSEPFTAELANRETIEFIFSFQY